MEPKQNMVGWFEIPTSDFKRAVNFYESVFSVKLTVQDLGQFKMALFPATDKHGAAGALVNFEASYTPSDEGVLIYFISPSDDLAKEEAKIVSSGGMVLISKRMISENMGFMGLYKDTEGNRFGIRSKN